MKLQVFKSDHYLVGQPHLRFMHQRIAAIDTYKAIKLIKAKKRRHGQKTTNHCRTMIIALIASTKEEDQKKIISTPINSKMSEYLSVKYINQLETANTKATCQQTLIINNETELFLPLDKSSQHERAKYIIAPIVGAIA